MGSSQNTTNKDGIVRINIELGDEPAKILNELKQRGLVKDNPDAVSQALLALYDRVLKRDLVKLRLGLLGEQQKE